MQTKKINKVFLEALKEAYRGVISSDQNSTPKSTRILVAEKIKAAFELINYQIKGSENLPYESGSIFIYNHLLNHQYLTVDTNFQLTLDSHFISSKILYNYYGTTGERVVRYPLPEETNHKAYYDALDYTKVYSKAFTTPQTSKEKIKAAHENFRIKTTENLNKQKGLVFSPEGNSYSTENSPGPFKKGIFRLAASLKKQPYIVPLIMSGFDKLPSEAIYKCEIMPAFKMSDYGINSPDHPEMENVVQTINNQYKVWVKALAKKDVNFKDEIEILKKRVNVKKNSENLVVFYGSSSIRLWKSLETDFPTLNVLNLGFGGAYIDSLIHYFETLFSFKAPKAIVLYLGGNDLNLGYSAEKIVEMIKGFITVIRCKFPSTLVFNISIKPSIERIEKMETIRKINGLMQDFSDQKKDLFQVDFYKKMMKDGQVKNEFLLRDGLHLNNEGYKVLKDILQASFSQASI